MLPVENEALALWFEHQRMVRWRGVEVLKHPCDLISQAEIVFDTQPDVLLEAGTSKGGSALFYADLGVSVVSVDLAAPKAPPSHPNITFLHGSSTSPRTLYLMGEASAGKRVMVVLDSDHSRENVLAELDAYAGFVSPDCYLIAEDTNLDGPAAAVAEWLPGHPEFTADPLRERGVSHNCGGYLRRQ